jgi:hypothetical protein
MHGVTGIRIKGVLAKCADPRRSRRARQRPHHQASAFRSQHREPPRREGQGDRSPRRRQARPRRFQRSKPSRAPRCSRRCGPVPALTSAARSGGRTWRLAPPTPPPPSCTHPHAAGPMQQPVRIELHAPNPPDGSPRGKPRGPEADTFAHAQAEDENSPHPPGGEHSAALNKSSLMFSFSDTSDCSRIRSRRCTAVHAPAYASR